MDGTYSSEQKFVTVKKQFFVDEFKRETYARTDISIDEKREIVLNAYLYGILECIKYHFKTDALKDKYGYDFPLIEEVLANTCNERLYSRFGAFYNEKRLSFNHLNDDNEIMVEAMDEAINPFTGEVLNSSECQIVMYYAEHQKRSSGSSKIPYKLLNYKQNIYTEMPKGKTIKEILKEYISNKFNIKPKKLQT